MGAPVPVPMAIDCWVWENRSPTRPCRRWNGVRRQQSRALVRLNLSALMHDTKIDMIIQAVDSLARIAPDYASDYNVDSATARFRMRDLSRGSLAS